MKFFEKHFDIATKKDPAGRTVYFPWAFWGKGRVIESPAVEARMRKFVGLYNMAWALLLLTILFLAQEPEKTLYLILAGAIIPLIFLLASERILSGCPVSDLSLSWKEHLTRIVRRTPGFLLLILLICCFILVFIFGTSIFTAVGIHKKAVLILATLFSGVMFGATLYSFVLKSEEDGAAAAEGK